MNIKAINGYTGVTSFNKVNQKATASSFLQALTAAQANRDNFTSSLSEQDWFNNLRSRFTVSDMNWKQGQNLVSELAGRGLVRNDLTRLGEAIVIMFPPEDAYDEHGFRLIDNGANWAELKMDDGFENTTDYTGTLKSSLEHQWQTYNSMVEKYGDIYPSEKAYLQEQEKLLGILQRLA